MFCLTGKLGADTQKVRGQGLEDLKRILWEQRNSDKIEEDIFHTILELLYKTVSKEKPVFLRATTKPTTRNTASSRLQAASAALRLVVEVATPKLCLKTALSVLDHIIDTLPSPDGSLCEPLQNDYLKCFRILLGYAPHGEHMRRKQWQAYVDFALACLSAGLDDAVVDSSLSSSRSSSAASRNIQQLSLRLSHTSGRSTGKENASNFEDILTALKNLTSFVNAPVMSRAAPIAEKILDFLQVDRIGQEGAFETLNNVIFVSLTEDVAFTQTLLSHLIPIIRRLWSSRSILLQQQMLITLFSCRYLFLAPSGPWPAIDSTILEPLLTTVMSDYRTRNERDVLHFDDLQPILVSENTPLQLRQFKPARNSPRAVTSWFILSIIACLIVGLNLKGPAQIPTADPEEVPRKRQKVQSRLDEILELAMAGNWQEKLVALQIIMFLFDQPGGIDQEWTKGLYKLLPELGSEDPTVQTWIFLVFSRLALDNASRVHEPSNFWVQVWDAASRAMTVVPTTRAACHALNVLLQVGALDSSMSANLLESTLFGGGNNGPSNLTDTSLALMTGALRSKFFDNERRFESFGLKIIGWLTVRWTLPSNLDRLHNAHIVCHARPELLFGLLSAICGLADATAPGEAWTLAHSLFKSSMMASANLDFLQYLLSIPSATIEATELSNPTSRQFDTSTLARLFRTVMDFLANKTRDFLHSWKAIYAERISNIGNDIVEILGVVTTVSSALWVRCSAQAPGYRQPLILPESRRVLTEFVVSRSVDRSREMANRICACIVTIHKQLSRSSDGHYGEEYQAVIESALQVVRHAMAPASTNDPSDLDFLDDDAWDSQATQRSQNGAGMDISRLDIPVCSDLRSCLARYAVELTTALQRVKSKGLFDSSATALVIDQVLALDPISLVAARGAVQDFLNLKTAMAREDAHRLLKKLGELYLGNEAFGRCEAALCFCLNVLESLTDLWAAEAIDDALAETALDIYYWFVNTMVRKGVASQRVLSAMANLLDVLLRKSVSYGGEDLPSPRTSLLNVLEVSDSANQHRLAEKLSHIFEKYVLTQHEAIFDDVVGKLPSDPDNTEGIAVRLYIVSYLGARWHTVLRQATYHLFETVAHVPSTTKIGYGCIVRTCKVLELDRPRQLFKLFSPQIFYTWLSQETLASMPFQLFEYASLQEMAADNIGELTGQIALRGFRHSEELAQLVGKDWNSLLTEQFAYAEAYTLASETSVPKTDRLYDGSEKLVRKQLGSQLYLQRLRECLPDIIALLVISLQDDRGIEKALPAPSLKVWQEIVTDSGQNMQLPLAQQPCFRARCLPEELKYLCSRLHLEETDIWTSGLLVHVYRQLLDRARPALGPLHTCSIIRKIRIVISLAGPVAREGYPLEMMLHNLRPYLTVFQCAEETMGIYRFLLRHGTPSLSCRPSFIAGLGVSIFASLTGFITSSQDSTTQEEHFISTMTNAQDFRAFLGQYLESLELTNAGSEALRMYRLIIRHAKAIAHEGSSVQGTSEGQLLYALLSDQSSKDPLLSDFHFDLSIKILCHRFYASPDYQDDILANDDDASQFSATLENLLRRFVLDKSFRIWAAQVVGRGFIMRGLTATTNDKAQKMRCQSPDVSLEAVSSHTNIMRYLVDLLWKSDYPALSFAENTLQLISSNLNEADESAFLGSEFDRSLVHELRFRNFPCPPAPLSLASGLVSKQEGTDGGSHAKSRDWATQLLIQISEIAASDPILGFLMPLINAVPESAGILLPYSVHLILLSETNSSQVLRERLSQTFSDALESGAQSPSEARKLVLNTLLYLRKCRLPGETNMAQRNTWLEVDFSSAAIAASNCQMWHEALLFLELHYSQAQLQTGRSSRRSFVTPNDVSTGVISRIYENVDDPDFFYGNVQSHDIMSVINKMSHEGANQKSLSFQSAMLDSQLRLEESETTLGDVAFTTALALSAANMRGISEAVKQHYEGSHKPNSAENSFNMDQWDLFWTGDSPSASTTLSSLFRNMHGISNKISLTRELDLLLLQHGDAFRMDIIKQNQLGDLHGKLAVLAEARQIVGATSVESLESACAAIVLRNQKAQLAEFNKLSPILAGREATFAAIRRNNHLRAAFALSLPQALLFEVQVTRQSLNMASSYEAPQFRLNRAMYLSQLTQLAENVGLKVDVAINYDLAKTLWAQEEVSASIGILQNLRERKDASQQAINVARADILTDLGHKIAEARLEKPDEIIERYLAPAIREIQKPCTGSAAGRVFHNFAAFCDMQLQDTDNLDDFTRINKIRDRKKREVRELDMMVRNAQSEQQRARLKIHLARAKTWYKLDEEEWRRVSQNRENLILRCLENYLLSMRASDDYPNDTLRFIALWLNQAESPTANAAVHKHLSSVPTIKFAPLVNQLSSRLLDIKDDFQVLLKDLMFRICSDHPYHSLYQIFATSKSKAPPGDEVAASRFAAANTLTQLVKERSPSSAIWTTVHNTCVALNRVAVEGLSDKDLKSGSKLPLRKLQNGPALEAQITKPNTKIPPPTMNIALRADRDYSNVPTSTMIDPEISVATGVSAPKIATITASDGSRHKLLLKGGNDDLRQDAIMEQVFEQVSNLLKDHRVTRQRNLAIRTYKVIPLTKNSGVIEFVQNTIPLNEYLLPAHARYYPKDYKASRARKDIAEAQTKNHEQRVRAYQTVTANFHPVMRFFFMEKFLDPDDWFYKRLNYSRSTAAVSILGHVLGLGDRHGHNILLDEKTGEVVHIDLGVAFEAGRVLPVPEVVPFRLTRDLVDGMGLTGVEGVFRRCCNFTLEALRHDQEAIMTILDVLRYDPLYSWSISPLRLQKMQENNEQAAADAASIAGGPSTPSTTGGGGATFSSAAGAAAGVIAARREETEPSEADRALTVVAKKLGKALSVEATVNELIRQATDERNLAVLYCGWAAYA
ncbi:uncharacterized protein Z519_08714 [Cladophialophora bantiana CBS 173.52]|uniref:Serine/threonine-protein kinase Tel1 n=1 Tax=Cladophialophora bantiana (strain ATCC 10958 / CBS 173.52 / CDC B-1940 / NIH 8579) TaxID=1442370 RepID=A0A0D2ELT1_CLAB1|nr:uncharacterized protein Z519_08714 [Cladophialophora bantiana CBS 173.52]KIW90931.1 hypothetical protein Z519_08714 [Cladophialophora bantiana CBS 173.52]